MHRGAGNSSIRSASSFNAGPYFPYWANSKATSSKAEIKLTAVKFKMISITSVVERTKRNTTNVDIIPWENLKIHDKLINPTLSPGFALENFGKVSTAVTISFKDSSAKTQ